MPPWIWPSTNVGLMARPTSWAATIADDLGGAEHGVDLHFGHLRGEAVGGVGNALTVRVERAGRRVPAAQAFEHRWSFRRLGQAKRRPNIARPRRLCWVIAWLDPTYDIPERCEIERARGLAVGDRELRALQRELGVRAGVGERQDLPAQVLGRQARGIAGDERLARGRGLAGVLGQVGVADHHAEGTRRQARGRRRRSAAARWRSPGRCRPRR